MEKRTAEMIVDDNGIQILVDYTYEISNDGGMAVGKNFISLSTASRHFKELHVVNIIFGDHCIDISKLLHPSDKDLIISKLNYDL